MTVLNLPNKLSVSMTLPWKQPLLMIRVSFSILSFMSSRTKSSPSALFLIFQPSWRTGRKVSKRISVRWGQRIKHGPKCLSLDDLWSLQYTLITQSHTPSIKTNITYAYTLTSQHINTNYFNHSTIAVFILLKTQGQSICLWVIE